MPEVGGDAGDLVGLRARAATLWYDAVFADPDREWRTIMKAMLMRIPVDREDGHATPLGGTLIGGTGAILLAIGAANDTGVLAIVGGIAIGLVATVVLNHVGVDYDVYRRLTELEK